VDAAIGNDPGNAYAYLLRGDVRLALGRIGLAEADYRDAVSRAPDFPNFALRLAGFLAKQGRRDEAIAVYLEILKREPGERATHVALAELYEQLGRTGQAAFHRAFVALNDGDIDAAEHRFADATAREPAWKDAWLGRAVVAVRQAKADEAEAMLAHALALAPTDPEALTLKGETALARNDSAAAEQAFKAAIAAEPHYVQALLHLADLAKARGDCVAALPLYRTASETAPQAAAPRAGMGQCHEALGQFAEAASDFRAAIARAPLDARAANSLAWLELTQGENLPEALLLAKRASLLLPGDAEIIDTLGWAYVRNGRPDLAEPNLRTALAALGDEPTVLYHLGIALAALGRKQDAIAALQAAEQAATHMDFPDAAEAHRELERLSQDKGD
jgi:tetratricopeptide (TPR) repeat protein